MATSIQPYVNPADGYPRASFTPTGASKLEWPYKKFRYKSELRHHEHEFLHADGARIEKQGRKIWVVTFEVCFFDSFKAYPKLYPYTLDAMCRAFEQGLKGVLVVPSPIIGAIDATCVNFDSTVEAQLRSGEVTNLEFKEDREDDFLFAALIDLSTNAIASATTALLIEVPNLGLADTSIFDQIKAVSNDVARFTDGIDRVSMQLESKLEFLASLCDQADNLVVMRSPAASNAINALHDLWAATIRTAKDLLFQRSPLQSFVTPGPMSVGQVAGDSRVYGDASRGEDILQLNPSIEDPFRIPAGTTLQFYPDK